jgi:group I intron endonuclease
MSETIIPLEKAYIYKITNKINGKLYIGETAEKNPQTRWAGHLYTIRKGKGCPLLGAAFKKYGEENFIFEVIHECAKEERFNIEKQKIIEYNTLVPNGYNATLGGMGGGFKGKKHSEETKKKMAASTSAIHAALSVERKEELHKLRIIRSKNLNKGVEFREKMRNLNLGKKLSEETRSKISESLKSKSKSKYKSYTEERKANISKKITEIRGVKIAQYTNKGEFIKTYPSIKSASIELGIPSIQAALKGTMKTAGGFIWKRVEKISSSSE